MSTIFCPSFVWLSVKSNTPRASAWKGGPVSSNWVAKRRGIGLGCGSGSTATAYTVLTRRTSPVAFTTNPTKYGYFSQVSSFYLHPGTR